MNLSIIIPCYNNGISILKLLENIYSQIVNRSDIEVIIVDDGSSDNTAEVINEFHHKKNELCHFYLYQTENQGAAKARTFGLSKARGMYVFFCDSDDNVAECFIEKINSEIEKKPDIIYFNSIMVNNNVTPPSEQKKVFFDKYKIYEDKDDFLLYLLNNKYYTSAVWTYVFKRDLVFSSGASFTNRKAHEDHLFTIKLLCYAKKITAINQVLYIQIIRDGSLTNSKKDVSYINERYYAYKEVKEYMKKKFSNECIKIYSEWSLLSLLSLYRQNFDIAMKSFFMLLFLHNTWKDFLLMFILFFYKAYKKILK